MSKTDLDELLFLVDAVIEEAGVDACPVCGDELCRLVPFDTLLPYFGEDLSTLLITDCASCRVPFPVFQNGTRDYCRSFAGLPPRLPTSTAPVIPGFFLSREDVYRYAARLPHFLELLDLSENWMYLS